LAVVIQNNAHGLEISREIGRFANWSKPKQPHAVKASAIDSRGNYWRLSARCLRLKSGAPRIVHHLPKMGEPNAGREISFSPLSKK
jgi:hypothetical protein